MVDQSLRAQLLKHVAEVHESHPLHQFSPLGAGGVADYFAVVHTTVELAAAVKAAIDSHLPYVVLGEGSQMLFSDGGFPGLVIHNLANHCAIARDRSQVVVDSGVLLRNLVTQTANQGLGGLTSFFADRGTVGGAIFTNKTQDGVTFHSLVRYATFIIPPARLDKEATIVRYRIDWLQKSENQTKLQFLRQTKGVTEPQPVLLTALLQLTNVRTDELSIRLQKQATRKKMTLPKAGPFLGPLFYDVDATVADDFLAGIEAHKIQIGNCAVIRNYPNFMVAARGNKPVLSSDIRGLIEELQARVEEKYGIRLRTRYEYVGAW